MLKFSIMKINRRGFLVSASSALVLAKSELASSASTQPSEIAVPTEIAEPLSVEGKEIAVYTTAANSNLRLSATDHLAFKPLGSRWRLKFVSLSIPPGHFKRF